MLFTQVTTNIIEDFVGKQSNPPAIDVYGQLENRFNKHYTSLLRNITDYDISVPNKNNQIENHKGTTNFVYLTDLKNTTYQIITGNDFLKSVLNNQLDSIYQIESAKITNELIEIQKNGSIEKSMDFIFETFDSNLTNNKFAFLNYLLKSIDVKHLNIQSIVGILTITSTAKTKLVSRNYFYKVAYSFICQSHSIKDTDRILKYLE